VCIVADGRKVVDSRVLKVLQLMGVYAEVSPALYFMHSGSQTDSKTALRILSRSTSVRLLGKSR
jgi:hypothetical protein